MRNHSIFVTSLLQLLIITLIGGCYFSRDCHTTVWCNPVIYEFSIENISELYDDKGIIMIGELIEKQRQGNFRLLKFKNIHVWKGNSNETYSTVRFECMRNCDFKISNNYFISGQNDESNSLVLVNKCDVYLEIDALDQFTASNTLNPEIMEPLNVKNNSIPIANDNLNDWITYLNTTFPQNTFTNYINN